MAPRIVSIIGSRPEIVQAAPLSLAFADCVEEILVHTGQLVAVDRGGAAQAIHDRRFELALDQSAKASGSSPGAVNLMLSSCNAVSTLAGVLEPWMPCDESEMNGEADAIFPAVSFGRSIARCPPAPDNSTWPVASCASMNFSGDASELPPDAVRANRT